MLRLNLVVIRSRDVERSANFYREIGLSFDKHRHGDGPEHCACNLDGVVFEIYPACAGGSTAATRLGFAVEDVDAVAESLLSLGARMKVPAADSPWGRRAVLEDADGHAIELTQSAT